MTISLVVNGRADRLTPATRERVERAIAELGYRPNASARGLRLRRGHAIGMIVLDASPSFLAAPFTTHLVAGLSNRLGESGYALTLQGLPPQRAGEALALRRVGTDALCALTAGTGAERERLLEAAARLGQPLVLFEETLVPVGLTDLCTIRQDDHGGGMLLGRHVIWGGARRLAMLVPRQEWPSVQERRRGVQDAMAEAGLEPGRLEVVACGNEGVAATRDALLAHIARPGGPPDAVLAANDQMGITALLALKAAGVAVPQRAMVTGFNGFAFRDYTDPVLTTVRSAAYEMGAAGADAVLARLATGRFPDRDIRLPVALLPGGTTRDDAG
jgi:LacI family transcriptional regulator